MKKNRKNLISILTVLFAFAYLPQNSYSFGLGDVLKNLERVKKVAKIGKSGMKAFSDISEEEQYYIGRSVGARLFANHRLSKDEKLWNYVSSIGQTLALASERPDTFKGYHFMVLDEPDKINAFSVPSGFIFVSTGLIRKASNEDELAAVLAHEVAHIVYYHPTDSIKKVYKDQIKKDIVALAADEISASQKSQIISGLVQGLNEISGMLVDNAAKGYSREKEDEADLMAAVIMKNAGYNPEALVEVLTKLNPIGSGKSGTHGDPKKRSTNVLTHIKKFKSHSAIADSRTKRFNQVIKPSK